MALRVVEAGHEIGREIGLRDRLACREATAAERQIGLPRPDSLYLSSKGLEESCWTYNRIPQTRRLQFCLESELHPLKSKARALYANRRQQNENLYLCSSRRIEKVSIGLEVHSPCVGCDTRAGSDAGDDRVGARSGKGPNRIDPVGKRCLDDLDAISGRTRGRWGAGSHDRNDVVALCPQARADRPPDVAGRS